MSILRKSLESGLLNVDAIRARGESQERVDALGVRLRRVLDARILIGRHDDDAGHDGVGVVFDRSRNAARDRGPGRRREGEAEGRGA